MKKTLEILVNQIIIFSIIGSIVGVLSHYFTEIAIFSAEFVRSSVDYKIIGFIGQDMLDGYNEKLWRYSYL